MSTHSLDNQLEERLVNRIAELERQIREMRTVQQSSADGIQVVGYPIGNPSFIVDSIAANTVKHFTYQIQPHDNRLTNWNFFVSVYVDLPGSTLESTHQLPFGSSLSSAQKNIVVSTYPDWGNSSDLSGVRTHIVTVDNRDSNSHNLVIAGKFYGPYIEVI